MDKRFVQYYERELRYIRELGSEFARAFPKVAGRLGIEAHACDDPHVERLFQGHSLLAARVQERLDAEFPRLTQELLESVYPSYLAPTPSMAIVQFQPDPQQGSLERGYEIAAGSALRVRSRVRMGATCEYRTAHPVRLWPIAIESARYTAVLQDFAELRMPTREPTKALLRLTLRTTGGRSFSQLGIKSLPMHLGGADEQSGRLYEALVAHGSTLVMRWEGKGGRRAARSSASRPVHAQGFGEDHALLPRSLKPLGGYRLIQEYLAFPARYHFVELCGLDAAMADVDSDTLELMVALDDYDPSLEGTLAPSRLVLFATPAINLFARTCDLVQPERNGEPALLVPDRARPLDLEVHTVQRVSSPMPGSTHEHELPPQRVLQAQVDGQGARGSYLLERRARIVSYEEQQLSPASAHYPGDDVFISVPTPRRRFSLAGPAPLRVEALCTNRDLPLQLDLAGETPFTTPSGAPVRAVRCLAGPTAPHSGVRTGEDAWALISHLSQHHLLVGDDAAGGAGLREFLGLCGKRGDAQLQREIEGVSGLRGASVVRPLPKPGPREFARGLELTLTCEEKTFGGHRAFLLAAVLSQFFAKYASVPSFTETVLRTTERGDVHRWPAVAGLRGVV